MKKLAVFDIEVLPNIFICCIKVVGGDTVIFEISSRRNDLNELIEFFTCGEYIFVGYNCIHYDTPIVNMLIMHQRELTENHNFEIITNNCKKMSDLIIDGEPIAWSRYKYANKFPQIDLMTMMSSKALRVGLKVLQVSMCYPNVEEMEVDWNSWLKPEFFDSLISYCINDIESTTHLLKLLKQDLQLRSDIEKEFGLECYSKDGVGIGVQLFTNFMIEDLNLPNEDALKNLRDNYPVINVRDFILPEIELKTKAFKSVYSHFMGLTLNEYGLAEDSSITVMSNGLRHTCGLGGIDVSHHLGISD